MVVVVVDASAATPLPVHVAVLLLLCPAPCAAARACVPQEEGCKIQLKFQGSINLYSKNLLCNFSNAALSLNLFDSTQV